MELKLLEAQHRIRSLAAENQSSKRVETDLARERLKTAAAERLRLEERSRLAQLESMNQSLAEELQTERQQSHRRRGGSGIESSRQMEAKDREIESLKTQLAEATARGERDRAALMKIAATQHEYTSSSPVNVPPATSSSSKAELVLLRTELDRTKADLATARLQLVDLRTASDENVLLRQRISELELAAARRGYAEESNKNMLRLQEENSSLRQKLNRAQGAASKLVKVETELEQMHRELSKWKVAISSEYPSLDYVQDTVGRLKGQVNGLTVEKTTLEEALQSAKSEAAGLRAELEQMSKSRTQKVASLEEQRQLVKGMEDEVKLLRERLNANQVILDSFNAEGNTFSNYDSVKVSEIARLCG